MSKRLKKVYPKLPLISRLPRNVLVNIFFLVTQSYYHYSSARHLASVCRLWREIILSTPTFWSRVSLSRPVGRFATYLSRSQRAPVDVSIEIEEGTLSVEELDQSLDLLHVHWPHLRSLRVLPRDSGYDEQILETFNSAIQTYPDCIVEEIYVKLGEQGDDDESYSDSRFKPQITPYLFLPPSQVLRSIELRGLNIYPVHPHPFSALLGVQKLTLTESSMAFLCDGLLALLSLTPNLRALNIFDYKKSVTGEEVPEIIDTSTISPILLLGLEKLSLIDFPLQVVNNLLRKLDMPNLRTFCLHTDLIYYMRVEMDWDAISRYHGLECLSFKGLPRGQTGAVVSWLKKLDNLEKLEIFPDMIGSEPHFAEAMARQLIKTAYSPNFKFFYLYFHPPSRLRMCLRALTVTRPSMCLDVFA